MTPAARVQAAIECLDRILDGAPAEQVLTGWARGSRFAGSGDRNAVRDHVFDALRARRSLAALGGGDTGRAILLGLLRRDGVDPDSRFTGEPYAPKPLSETERSGGRPPLAGAEAADLPDWLWPRFVDSLGADAAAAILEDLEAKAQAAFEEAKAAAGCITDNFGMRYHPIYGVWKLHSGVDIGAGYDQPIYAAHSGVVIYAGWFSDLGYYVKIDHGGGMVSGYGHIREGGLRVSTGQWVDAGQVIAKVGSTGGSTGPHLHYMMYSNGNLIDPVPYMRDHGVRIGC